MNTTHAPTLFAFCLPLVLLTACGSDSGDPSQGPSFAGHTYLLSIPRGAWEGQLGSEVSDSVPEFVLKVEAGSGGYDVMLGTAREGEQDMCNKTATVSASGSYPSFQLGPVDYRIYVRHPVQAIAVDAMAYGLTMTDILPTEDMPASEGTLSAMMDAREIYPLFPAIAPEPTPDRVCETVANEELGQCEACPDDGEEYCLELSATYLGADEVNDLDLQPVDSVPASCFELE